MKRDYYAEHYARLLGKTISGIVKDDSDESFGVIYGLRLDSGEIAWVLTDPEGNGPGHIDIMEG